MKTTLKNWGEVYFPEKKTVLQIKEIFKMIEIIEMLNGQSIDKEIENDNRRNDYLFFPFFDEEQSKKGNIVDFIVNEKNQCGGSFTCSTQFLVDDFHISEDKLIERVKTDIEFTNYHCLIPFDEEEILFIHENDIPKVDDFIFNELNKCKNVKKWEKDKKIIKLEDEILVHKRLDGLYFFIVLIIFFFFFVGLFI